MKNFKKIISVIIAFSVIMSSFGVFAREYYDGYEYMDDVFRLDVGAFVAGEDGAAEEDGTVDAGTARIMLLDTLGIWDDPAIAKTEFVAMTDFLVIMAKLKLGADNSFEGVYKLNPDEDYATYNHAYTYLVEALGYSHKCSNYPGAKDANLIVASEIGLMESRPENAGGYITRDELAKLIFRALTIDMCTMEITKNGNYKYTVVKGKNLLNSVHNIYEITGFVNAIPGLSVYGGATVREGYIQVDRRNINTSGMDLSEYFGNRVKLYALYDEEINEYNIIYIDYAEDNNVFEIDFSDIVYKDKYSVYYVDDDGVEQEIDIDSLTYITENGKKLTSMDEMCSYAENEGKIIFTSTTKSEEFDAAIIYKYNYYVVNNVDTRLAKVAFRYGRKYGEEGYIQLDLNKVNSVYINGLKAEYSQIPIGSAIRVFRNEATGYTEIISSNETIISGAVSGLYENYAIVADNEFRLAKDWELFVDEKKNDTSIPYTSRPKELELGEVATLFVIDGIIAGYESTEDFTYGFIKSITKARTSIDPDLTFRIFTQTGEWKDLTVKDKCEFDGEPNVSKERILEIINQSFSTTDPVTDHPIRFRGSAEGELLALDTVIETKYEAESTEDITFNGHYALNRDWTNENIRDASFIMSPKVAIFVVPNGATKEEDYKITTYNALVRSSGTPVKIYNINQYRQLELMVSTQADGGGTSSDEITPFYVQSIRKTIIDPDNQIYGYKLTGKQMKYVDRASGNVVDSSYFITEDMLDVNKEDEEYSLENVIETGDFLNITISGTEIVAWEMLYKGGVVPQEHTDGTSNITKNGSDGYYAVGTFVRADPVQGIYVVKIDGTEYACIPFSAQIINPVTKKLVKATTTDFEEGDPVCYYARFGRCHYFFKNEY